MFDDRDGELEHSIYKERYKGKERLGLLNTEGIRDSAPSHNILHSPGMSTFLCACSVVSSHDDVNKLGVSVVRYRL